MTHPGDGINQPLTSEQMVAMVNPRGLSVKDICAQPPHFATHSRFGVFMAENGMRHGLTSMWTGVIRPLVVGQQFSRILKGDNAIAVDIGSSGSSLMVDALRMNDEPVARLGGHRRRVIDPADPESWSCVALESVEVNLVVVQALLAQHDRLGSKLQYSYRVGAKTVAVWARFCHNEIVYPSQLRIDGMAA